MSQIVNNVGRLDAMVRGTIGVLLLLAAAALNQRPFLAVAAGLLAVVLILTALTRSCPVYTVAGLSTRPRKACATRFQ
jgi:DUF2892 family protein